MSVLGKLSDAALRECLIRHGGPALESAREEARRRGLLVDAVGRFKVGERATIYGCGGLVTLDVTALLHGVEYGEDVVYVTGRNGLGHEVTYWQAKR